MTSFTFAGSVWGMNDIVGDITSTNGSGSGNLRQRLLVFRELDVLVVIVVISSSGEFNTENGNAVFFSMVACLRVVRHLFTHVLKNNNTH
jgi:hypothetical protein